MPIERFARSVARVAGVLALAAVALAPAGCSHKTTGPPVLPPLSRIDLVPATDTLNVGDTRVFVATAYDTGNAVVSGVAFAWTTSDGGVIGVNTRGTVTAMGEGSAKVYASAGGKTDSSVVFVRTTQGGWYTQTSNTARNLNGVFFQPDGRRGWAVGDLGTIVATANAGVNWSTQTSNTAFDLNGVWFTSDLVGWAAGNSGTVLKTTDGGTTWTRMLNIPASENLMAVRFADANHGWIVGANGVALTTVDGGVNWDKKNPTAQQLNAVAFSGLLDGWAVGEGGVIVGTHDGGTSWYVVQPAVTGLALRGVARRSNTAAWAAGAQGALPRTTATPDSLAWQLDNTGASNDMYGIQLVSPLVGYIVGGNAGGLVLKSETGGTTWNPQTSNSAQVLRGVYFVDELRGWAVGAGGRIVHTAKGGNP